MQLVGGDVWVLGVWNTRWGVGTARAGEGGFMPLKTLKLMNSPPQGRISLPTFFGR